MLRQDGLPEEPLRLATLLSAELAAEYADKIEDPRILAIEQRLAALAEAIATRYFLQGAVARARRENHGSGVIYDVIHLTRYRYGAPVAVNACALRLLPREDGGQTRASVANRGHAEAAELRSERIDPFDNRVTRMRIETPHRELVIKASSRVAGRAAGAAAGRR